MKLVFNCCGADTLVFAEGATLLKAARNEALVTTQAPPLDPADWEVWTQEGRLLDPEQPISQLPLRDGSSLFIRMVGDGN